MWDMLTFFSVAILEAVQRGPDLSFSRWWCYKSQRSFPVYLASEVQMWSNAPIPNQKSASKASKSRTIPYVPGVNPPEWSLVSAHLIACSAGVFVLELAVVSSPPYWLEQSRWGGGGGKRKKTPARKGCENKKHPLISCSSQIFRKWLIGQSKWTENYIIFPIKTNTREESTCYLQTSARIERVNYVVQKCLKQTLMIIVGFARFLSGVDKTWNMEHSGTSRNMA